MFVKLQPQLHILPVQRNVGLHQQVHLDNDPVIVVQIACVLEGRSEGAETLAQPVILQALALFSSAAS